MANSKAISIRIPDELLGKIDLLAEEKYKSHKGTPNRSLVVLDAIVAYFDTLSDTSRIEDIETLSDSVSVIEFKELQDSVRNLSDTIRQIENKLTIIPNTVRKLNESVKPKQGQLDLPDMSDNAISVDIDRLEDGLTATQLGLRLKEKPQLIGTNKKKPKEFTSWAKTRDPDGYGWRYQESSKLYYPIKPLA
jgi:metal-responsive CopG/Arc/MetJ family transcriptional regulator